MSLSRHSQRPSEHSLDPTGNQPAQDANLDIEELKSEYSRALSYITTLKEEKNILKETIESNLNSPNISMVNYVDSHRRSAPNIGNVQSVSPQKSSQGFSRLEAENKELRALLEAERQKFQNIDSQVEALNFENKQLKVDLNRLHEELCSMTAKVSELQVNEAPQEQQEQKIAFPEADRHSILKYTNYVVGLVNALDKNHFAYCCFEERFSKDSNIFNIAYLNDQPALLLKAFKFITDLLINISTNYHIGTPSMPTANSPSKARDTGSEVENRKLGSPPSVKKFAVDEVEEEPEVYASSSKQSTHHKTILKHKTRDGEVIIAKDFSESKVTSQSSLEEKTAEVLARSGKGSMRNNYISISELDPISKAQIRKESRDAMKDFESPKFVMASEPSHRQSPRKGPIYEAAAAKRQEEEVEQYRSEARGGLGSRELISKFKELKARCKEIREQESAMDVDARLKKHYYNAPRIEETQKLKNPLADVHKASSVNSLRNIVKETTFAKPVVSQSVNEIRRESEQSLTNQALAGWKVPTEEDYRSQGSRRLTNQSPGLNNFEIETGKNVSFISYVPPVRSPKEGKSYSQMSQAKRQYRDNDTSLSDVLRKSQQRDNSKVVAPKGTEFSSFRVAFGKTETKKRPCDSPGNRLGSVEDIPRRKKNGAYPSQSYDVIRGEELLRRKYLDQPGIMESTVIVRKTQV